MYKLRIISKENRLILRKTARVINIQARAKRGLPGASDRNDSQQIYQSQVFVITTSQVFQVQEETNYNRVSLTPAGLEIAGYERIAPTESGGSLVIPSGDSFSRPIGDVGSAYFDTTLGKPIWSNGNAWVDATGTEV